MDLLPGMLVVFGPLVIMGVALLGEACFVRAGRAPGGKQGGAKRGRTRAHFG
ncbi:MAG: hypothetical protein JWP36_292 [Paucimonas sp.]|nr:hypothetical protein [Paucimonas sp.]